MLHMIKGYLYLIPKEVALIRDGNRVTECWMVYALPAAGVIFRAKTSSDIFSLRQEQVLTFSVLGDRIYEMRCLFVAIPSL